MLLAGLFGLVTTVASALPGGMAGVSPDSSATSSGVAGQECAAAGRHAPDQHCDRQRAAQRSEALRAGAAFYHRYYAAVLSRHQGKQSVPAALPEASAVQAVVRTAGPGPDAAPARGVRAVLSTARDQRPPSGAFGETDPVRGPPSSTDL